MAKVHQRNSIDFRNLDYEDPQDMDLIEAQCLDDLLALSEPWRTNALRVWVKGHGRINIKASKTPFKRSYYDGRRWRAFTIQPKGQNFDREEAIQIIQRYGEHGRYRGKDQATSLTNQYLQSTSQAERDMWAERGVKDIDDTYVYHDNKQAKHEEQDEAA